MFSAFCRYQVEVGEVGVVMVLEPSFKGASFGRCRDKKKLEQET